MADDRYRDERDDRFDDDRPSRRDSGDRPKKKSALPMILIILGVVGVLCAGACGGIGYWFYSIGMGGQKAVEGVLAKVGNGDTAGAYNAMSPTYKTSHTQEQFEKAMRDAKLTDYASVVWSKVDASNQTMKLSGTATLKSGTTTPVAATVKMMTDMKTWEVEDLGDGTVRPTAPPAETK